jgi:5'-deoxynucleotidase YfbR-like HD superfamily hydrolase
MLMSERPPSPSTPDSEHGLIEFAFLIGRLKRTPRTGWTRYPIPNPESVADHSFRLATLAMLLAPQFGVDPVKSANMAILHDLGESIIGDIVTDGGTSDLPNLNQKLADERTALHELLSSIGAEHHMGLYDEFASNETPEAQFVNQLDKIEMAVQAREYELAHGVELGEFYDSAERRVHDPQLTNLLSTLRLFTPE